jgi:lysozyme
MKPSANFIKLCHGSEGCRLKSYQDPGGIWTIGWGHTFKVKKGDTITQEQADQLFYDDCEFFVTWLNKQPFTLSQSAFDAILDLIYNIGPGNLSRDIELYNSIKYWYPEGIKEGFMRHTIDSKGNELPGLVTRRKSELKLMFG